MAKPQQDTAYIFAPLQEAARAHLVKVVFIVYWLLIFDGALRKWFLPMLQQPLFFLKDVFVIYAYWYAWRNELWPEHSVLLKWLAGLLISFLLLALIQGVMGVSAPLTSAYGYRMYFFLVPLAFLIGQHFRGPDLSRFVRQNLLIGIGMAALVFVQYKSPINSPVNKLLDADSVAFSYGELARASGTFSFTQGHALFTSLLFVLVITCWTLPKSQRPIKNNWVFYLATVGAITNVLLDGNRSIFLYCAFSIMSSLAYKILSSSVKPVKLRDFAPESVVVVGAILYLTLFSSALESMTTRVQMAQEAEDPVRRALNTVDISHALDRLKTPFGEGIGNGIPASQRFRGQFTGQVDEENELPRVVMETGVLGLVWIAFRVSVAVLLLRESITSCKEARIPLAIFLCSNTVPNLIIGQLSFNGTAHYFGWLLVGLTLAATKVGAKKV